jgi:hypothetical protein
VVIYAWKVENKSEKMESLPHYESFGSGILVD